MIQLACFMFVWSCTSGAECLIFLGSRPYLRDCCCKGRAVLGEIVVFSLKQATTNERQANKPRNEPANQRTNNQANKTERKNRWLSWLDCHDRGFDHPPSLFHICLKCFQWCDWCLPAVLTALALSFWTQNVRTWLNDVSLWQNHDDSKTTVFLQRLKMGW